jgi:hypothetical protein
VGAVRFRPPTDSRRLQKRQMKEKIRQKRGQWEGIGEAFSPPCNLEFLAAFANALRTTQQALQEVSPQ